VSQVYSKRFVHLFPPETSHGYVVPAGRIAVVKSAGGTNRGTTGGFLWMLLNGQFVWSAALPGQNNNVSFVGHLVAYAGDSVALTASSTGSIYGFISGYEFLTQ
jgi:hypothetical protein